MASALKIINYQVIRFCFIFLVAPNWIVALYFSKKS